MRSIPLGISVSSTSASINNSKTSSCLNNLNFNFKKSPNPSFPSRVPRSSHGFSPSKSGVCGASQVVDLFPIVSPQIVVREARLEDCWEVAETHCSSFFPEYSFPLDFVLRVDRLMAMLAGFSLPNGCRRTCLVAVIGSTVNEAFFFGCEDFKIGAFDGKFNLNKGYVAGILTVDTVADFLPRKGPLRQRSIDEFITGLELHIYQMLPFGRDSDARE
ncbi:hypothetical protein I3760_01G269800 [Carya illinoinensis]|uniref:Uncharacterized protein n=1 Tax=Carya illinoinensis TaxID=32201 RepID=A0A8T1RT21_CARIL|nr:hypothetical protein I3760_01G269800 [Carya illinoinensis]KAG6669866.1 hypothetical protein CIPAW_01G272400 [Carya illinoinensis]